MRNILQDVSKQAITGSGGASKEQVAAMLQSILEI